LLKNSFFQKNKALPTISFLLESIIFAEPIKQKHLVRESDSNSLSANIFDHNHSRIHNHPPVASHTRAEKTKRCWTTQNN